MLVAMPLSIGLSAITNAPSWRSARARPTDTQVLPTPVPVPRTTRTRTVSAEASLLTGGSLTDAAALSEGGRFGSKVQTPAAVSLPRLGRPTRERTRARARARRTKPVIGGSMEREGRPAGNSCTRRSLLALGHVYGHVQLTLGRVADS